ncbi:MAG TPA: hypothetical protein VLX56_00020 [Nitrososphaerales archaeon]|nr:hypothetical protein [Nitrososphaerales archaeon]
MPSRRTVLMVLVLGLLMGVPLYGIMSSLDAESATATSSATSATAGDSPSSSVLPPTSSTASQRSRATNFSTSSAASTTAVGDCFSENDVDDSLIPGAAKLVQTAVVKPVFTTTPYSMGGNNSFYDFYRLDGNVTGNTTANIGMLSSNISRAQSYNDGWGLSYWLYLFLTSQVARNCGLVMGENLHVLDDPEVSSGGLFYPSNGSARFDVVIMPFSEYVTVDEYTSYQRFVAEGGTLIMTGGGSLLVRISYNATTGMETLVKGHGWDFDGVSARPDVFAAWEENNTNWVGSSHAHCCYGRTYSGASPSTTNAMGRALYAEFGDKVFKQYFSGEEDELTNTSKTSVVATFTNASGVVVASYVHQYKKGVVVCMCIQADVYMTTSKSLEYFLLLGIVSAELHTAISCSPSPEAAGSPLGCPTTPSPTLSGDRRSPMIREEGWPQTRARNPLPLRLQQAI